MDNDELGDTPVVESGDAVTAIGQGSRRVGQPNSSASDVAVSPLRLLSASEVAAQAEAAGLDDAGIQVLDWLFRYHVLRGSHIRQLLYPKLSNLPRKPPAFSHGDISG